MAAQPIGELVDQPGVAVEVEDHRLVSGEQAVELALGRAMGMLAGGLQLVEVHHVGEANFQLRQVLAQQRGRGQDLLGGHVAAVGHNDVRLHALVVARARPDRDALGAVHDRLVGGGELQVLLLVRDDDVDAVGRSQALVGHRQQGVGVEWPGIRGIAHASRLFAGLVAQMQNTCHSSTNSLIQEKL